MSAPVLYISYDGMTDPLGQSQVLPYLRGLAARGYRITLLSCEKPERFDASRAVIQDICNEAGINWSPIFYTAKPPVLSTLKDIRQLWKTARQLHAKHHFGMVHCRSYISALIGQKMKRRFGTKFLFDMRGFWADERVDGGLWDQGNPVFRSIYRYFKKKEIEFLQQADHTISLTQNAKDEIYNWPAFSVAKPSIQVIPCCVDLELFDPQKVSEEDKKQYRQQLGIGKDVFVLSYLGSLGTWYLLDDMLELFRLLRQRIPDARFLFISHDKHEEIRSKAATLGFADAIILHPAARKEVPKLLSLSSCSVYFIKPSYSKKASSPTKQGEIMAMGIPSVCNKVGDMDYVASKYGIGFIADTADKATFLPVVDALASGAGKADAGQIIRGAHEFYALDKGVHLYAEVYQQLLS